MDQDIQFLQIDPLEQTIIAATAFMVLIAGFVLYTVVAVNKKQVQRKKKETVEREKLVLNAKLEISEATMQTISQEIHDNIGQRLTLAKMNLNDSSQLDENQLANTRELITQALKDLRNLSKSLSGNYVLDLGLEKAIQRELQLVESSMRIPCTYSTAGEYNGMSEQKEVIAFRCIQEALNNAVKHSDASGIHIHLAHANENLEITITDNGHGFEAGQVEKGVGLTSIQQRIELLGGTYSIHSSPAAGTSVTLLIPLAPLH